MPNPQTTEIERLKNWLRYIGDNIPSATVCCEDALTGKEVYWWRTEQQRKLVKDYNAR